MRHLSIQAKFLATCIAIAFLTAAGISGVYMWMSQQNAHRDSQKRIQIAFDTLLDDFVSRTATFEQQVQDFLQNNPSLGIVTSTYAEKPDRIRSGSFAVNYLIPVSETLRQFGRNVALSRLALYGKDKRLLTIYQHSEQEETIGAYIVSEKTGNNSYLPLGSPSQGLIMMTGNFTVQERPLPPGAIALYKDDIPDALITGTFREAEHFGIRIVAPIYDGDSHEITGFLVGERLYSHETVERYAALSQTHIELVTPAEDLSEKPALATEDIISCQRIRTEQIQIPVIPVTQEKQRYYQGQCAFRDPRDNQLLALLRTRLSQEIEQQAIQQIYQAVMAVLVLAIGAAFALSWLLSHRITHNIHNIVDVLGSVAKGDLQRNTTVTTHDEIGILGGQVNQMIEHLQTMVAQIFEASTVVNGNAENLLREIGSLTEHMEQRANTVGQTVKYADDVEAFTHTVAGNTAELLSDTETILSATHEIGSALEGVTQHTTHLSTNVNNISTSIEQVNQSIRQISENAEQLSGAAQATKTAIDRIDQSFADVSQNADRSQELAKVTMNAALEGQTSVDESIRSIGILKDTVSQITEFIRGVSNLGAEVSSIIGVVDEVTEQTTLLSLNASIISAQAGEHGKGFAVVANEIKELANRTRSSTQEIGSLIRALEQKTEDGGQLIEVGLARAEHSVQTVNTVKDMLGNILESATQSSSMAEGTADVTQQIAADSQTISESMRSMAEMVSQITAALHQERQDIAEVAEASENILEMSKYVNQASLGQQNASISIVQKMESITNKLSHIAEQTDELRHNSEEIVTAMHTIESLTAGILTDTFDISNTRVNSLVKQADILQKIVKVFKVSS